MSWWCTTPATFVKRLIEQDQVDTLIGGTTTGETVAVVKLVEKAGLPFISLAGASVIVDPVQSWVFKTPHTDRMAVDKIYQDMGKGGIAAIGLIGGAGGFDQSCIANAQGLAAEHGLEIKAHETYGAKRHRHDAPAGQDQERRGRGYAVLRLRCGVDHPDQELRPARPRAAALHNHGSCSKQFIHGAGAAAKGVRLLCAALLVADQLPGDDPQKAVAEAYAWAYTEATDEEVSTFGGPAYDPLLLLVHALERAVSTDPAAARDALAATDGLVGVDGIFTMSPADHMGLGPKSFKMLAIENGDWKYLY
ncbi:MAG: putative branched-chain amino acid transporter system LivK [Geminicoccaceae bacterium]|nr:putative branched-chain amino acid transporter system LivK [Geminicoccaceae bacterium]MCE3248734.1 putative branched-chain amino acid transporter system LivK [Geminicoccaceae bacterium]